MVFRAIGLGVLVSVVALAGLWNYGLTGFFDVVLWLVPLLLGIAHK